MVAPVEQYGCYCSMKVSQAIEDFITSRIAKGCRCGTVENYRRFLSSLVHYSHIHQTTDITPQNVRKYLASRLTSGIKGSTVASERNAICTFLRWLSADGVVPDRDWLTAIPKVKTDKTDPRYLTDDECKRFIVCARNMKHNTKLAATRDPAMLYMFLDTTLRLGDMMSIKLTDLDVEGQSIRVSELGKGRKSKVVYFGDETAKLLRAYLKARPDRGQYLWVTRQSNKPSKSLILAIVQRVARRAGINDVCVHTLRHSSITSMIRNGMPIPHVQKLAGHSRIDMTMKYVHLVDEDVRKQFISACPTDRF